MTNNEIKLDKKATDYLKNKISGGSGGGVVLVDELPEKGDIGTLYRLKDGIYEWYHRETQVPVYEELEVGKSYLMKESLTFDDCDYVWNKFFEGRDRDTIGFNLSEQEDPYEIYFDYSGGGEIGYGRLNTYASYTFNDPDVNSEIDLEGFTEIPSITITEDLVSNIETDGEDLNDLQFLVELEIDHYDTVIDEGYIKISGSIKLSRTILEEKNDTLYLDDSDYDVKMIYNTILNGGTVEVYDGAGIEECICEKVNSYEIYKNIVLNCNQLNVYLGNMNYTFNILDMNKPTTITGSQIISQLDAMSQGSGSVYSWLNPTIFNFIYYHLTEEEKEKALADNGIFVSFLDEAIKFNLKVHQSSGEEADYSKITEIQTPYDSSASPFTQIIYNDYYGYPVTFDNINYNNISVILLADGYTGYKTFFDSNKEYSLYVNVTFGDGTIKSILLSIDFLRDFVTVAI